MGILEDLGLTEKKRLPQPPPSPQVGVLEELGLRDTTPLATMAPPQMPLAPLATPTPAESLTLAAPPMTPPVVPLELPPPTGTQLTVGEPPELRQAEPTGRLATPAEISKADIRRERKWLAKTGKVPETVAESVISGFISGATGLRPPEELQQSAEIYPRANHVGSLAGTVLLLGAASRLGTTGAAKILQQPYVRRVLLQAARGAGRFGLAGGLRAGARQVARQEPFSPGQIAKAAATEGAAGAVFVGGGAAIAPAFKAVEILTKSKAIEYTFDPATVAEVQRGLGGEAQEVAKLIPNWREMAARIVRTGQRETVKIPAQKIIRESNKPWVERFLKSLGADFLNKRPEFAVGVGKVATKKEPWAPVPAVAKGAKAEAPAVAAAGKVAEKAIPTPQPSPTPEVAPAVGKGAPVPKEGELLTVKPKVPEKRAAKPVTEAEAKKLEKEETKEDWLFAKGPKTEQQKIPETKKEKEPWEMTTKEYVADLREKLKASAVTTAKSGKEYINKSLVSRAESEAFGKKAAIDHVEKLKKAIGEGKSVPPEVLKDYPDIAPKAKRKPWQMTQKEFVAQREVYAKARMTAAEFERPSNREYNARRDHKQMVQSALSKGEAVPEEVLKDYPELAAKEKVKVPARALEYKGRGKREIVERRLPETSETRQQIEKKIEQHAEIIAGQFLKAPKGERVPIREGEYGEGEITGWVAQKSQRHPFLQEHTTKQVEKALATRKGVVWEHIKGVARDELESGGVSPAGKFPPDKEFLNLLDRAEAAIERAGMAKEAAPTAETIDSLERQKLDLIDEMNRRSVSHRYTGVEFDPEEYTNKITEINAKIHELERRMGGPPPPKETWKEILQKATDLGYRDDLTGHLNKQGFRGSVKDYLKDVQPQSGVVMFGDMDKFKRINDQFGHDIGDQAIKDLFAIIEKVIQRHAPQLKQGFMGRWGGDEFTVWLPNKTKAQGILIADEIREAVENTKILTSTKNPQWVTTTIGVTSYPDEARDYERLLTTADAKLKLGKESGRNRVIAGAIKDRYEAAAAGLDLEMPPHEQIIKAEEVPGKQRDLFEKKPSAFELKLSKVYEIKNDIYDKIWTFGPLRRDFPKLHTRAVRALFGRYGSARARAAIQMEKEIGKNLLTEEEYIDATEYWENRSLRNKASEKYKPVIDKLDDAVEAIEKEKLRRHLVKELFPDSAIHRNKDQIEILSTKPDQTTKDRQEIARLRKENEVLENTRWLTHRKVASAVLREKWTKLDPDGRRKFLGALRQLSFRYKMRKGRLYLKDYVDMGLLDAKDTDIRRVFTQIATDAEEKFALKDIWDDCKAAKLITYREEGPPGWVAAHPSITGFYAPELQGAWLHPAVSEMYSEMARLLKPMPGILRAAMIPFSRIKMMWFHKPGMIGWYDNIPQKAMGGSYGLNPVRELTWYWRSFWRNQFNHPDVQRFRAKNLFQSPYIIQGRSAEDEVEVIMRRTAKEFPRWKALAERIVGVPLTAREFTSLTGPLVHTFFNVTWNMVDHPSRTQQVYRLIDMGYSEDEAIEIVSKASGAYSETSQLFKKSLAPAFLVTNFRLLMPIEIMKALAVNPTRVSLQWINAKRGKGEPPPRHVVEKTVKSFLATIAIPIALEGYFKARGWESDKLGWKWRKVVKVEIDGQPVEREVVFAVNDIVNMPLKWWYRAMMYDPLGPKRLFQVPKNLLFWEIHPVHRVIMDIYNNRDSFGGQQIYDNEDPVPKQIGKIAWYAFNHWARIYPAVAGEIFGKDYLKGMSKAERDNQKKVMDAALNRFDRVLMYFGAYAYTRTPRAEVYEILDDKRQDALRKRLREIKRQADRERWTDEQYARKEKLVYELLGEGGKVDRIYRKKLGVKE